MNWFKKVKIEIERWKFRRDFNKGQKRDAEQQLRVIEKAERLSKERKCRLWVVRVEPGKYVIRTKADVKAILRRIGIKGYVDVFTPSDTIVHITK